MRHKPYPPNRPAPKIPDADGAGVDNVRSAVATLCKHLGFAPSLVGHLDISPDRIVVEVWVTDDNGDFQWAEDGLEPTRNVFVIPFEMSPQTAPQATKPDLAERPMRPAKPDLPLVQEAEHMQPGGPGGGVR